MALLACRHTCCHCIYTAGRRGDRTRHEKSRKLHHTCSNNCDRFSSLKETNMQVESPEEFRNSPKPTPSIPRKRSREATPQEDQEEDSMRERAEDPSPPPPPKPEKNRMVISTASLNKPAPRRPVISPELPRRVKPTHSLGRNIKQPSTTSHPRTSVPTKPTKLLNSSPFRKEQNLTVPSPSQGPGETSVPSRTQLSPVNPPNPNEPENPTKLASPPVEKGTPLDSADDPADGGGPASTRNSSPSQVAEPEPNQNETAIESNSRLEGPLAEIPPGESTEDSSDRSDIESLYASPSPEKAVMEPDPIELDSDPDFEMMERMLLSHRRPSVQSQSIKRESPPRTPAPLQAKESLKRARSRSAPDESSQAPTQSSQTNSKPTKRPRLNGPRSHDSVVVFNERRKHPEFWDLDGTVVLQVDDVLFRVMRSTLNKASPWFQRLFSEEHDNIEIMAGCPVYSIEGDLTHLDFANLLGGLENGLEYALNPPHHLRIVSIFRAASFLEFDTLRRWSLGCLEKQWPAGLPSPSKPSKFGSNIPWAEATLAIADRLDAPQLLKRAYWELCTRPEFGKIDAEVYDDEVEEIMPTRSRLSRSVLMDLTRIREGLLPEWTRITRYPPVDVSCVRATETPSTSTSTVRLTPCSLNYTNWHKVILEVEVNDMTIDDRRMDPISALEVMIIEIDWEKEGGFCGDCVKTWKKIWTKDREKIWKNLGDWLGLDAADES